MSINTYEIFTKITMVNGVSSVLGVIAHEVLNLEMGIGKLQSKLGSFNKTSLAVFGGLGIAAGGAFAAGLDRRTWDKASRPARQTAKVWHSLC